MRGTRKPTGKGWRRRLFEIALEVIFAVGLVIGICLYAVYGPKNPPFDFKWVPFGLNTAYVFGVALKTARPLWKKTKFWAVWGALLLAHALLGSLVLRQLERVPLIWYVPLVMVEVSVVLRAVEWSFAATELEQCAPAEARSKE
jgi:hypothetical protein